MSIVHRITNSLKAFRLNYSIGDFDRLLDQVLSGSPSRAGVSVSGDSALNFSAVFNAVQIITGTVASLPLILYRRVDEQNKERFVNHPLYNVLHCQANSEMTSFVFREIMQQSLLLYGNAYAEIIRDRAGRVIELWPWNPNQVKVYRDNKKIRYTLNQGAGKETTYDPRNVFHIPGLGFDGRLGYSVVTRAREAMGLGLAMEEFQARFYGQGTNLGGTLEHPGKLSDEAHKRLKKDITDKYAGLGNAHKVIVLEEGMKYESTGMPLEDAQFLESRVFQIGEIARWFNLPPHKLKELSKATFSNIEHQAIEFVQDSIQPWLVRWEQHIAWKLLTEVERKTYFAEFLIDGLLRGDTESRMKAYAIMRQNGVMNADEWRAKENMNPIGGRAGVTYWKPLNMADSDEKPEEPVEPAQPSAEDQPEEDKLPDYELRALRSVKSRRRTADAYKPVFRAIEKEILAKEIPAIKKMARKTLKTRTSAEFIHEMGEFYIEFRSFVKTRFAGLLEQYGEAIYPLAADEIGASPDLTDEYKAYLNEYADHSANRYIASSRGQLKSVVMEHRENDALAAVEKRLSEWSERRPDKVADLETVNAESGTAQFVYFAGGFETVWMTFDKSCPYCESLDGRTISRGMNFINAGQSFQPEGAKVPLIVTQNISHPAAHIGCDCTVRAGIGRSIRKVESDKLVVES